jgi:hypothetical protein
VKTIVKLPKVLKPCQAELIGDKTFELFFLVMLFQLVFLWKSWNNYICRPVTGPVAQLNRATAFN